MEGAAEFVGSADGLAIHLLDDVSFAEAGLRGGAFGIDRLNDEALRAAAEAELGGKVRR